MEIFGGFSTGASASGAMLKIESSIRSKTLYENRIPISGTLSVKIPSEPYSILLDSGPGHKIKKIGDIIPKGGFKKIKNENPINIAFILTLTLSIVFLSLTIILSLFKLRKFHQLKERDLQNNKIK